MLEFVFWFFLYVALLFLLIYIIHRFFSRHWKKTADTVIKRFLATIEKYPDLKGEALFMSILDERYPETNNVLKHLFHQKEYFKDILLDEIKDKKSILKKYNLPTLIYTCMVIERNNILFNKKKPGGIEKLMADIDQYVRDKGLERYI